MDLVTQNQMMTFSAQQGLTDAMDEPVLFEYFATFCSVSSEHSDDFEIEGLHMGGGDDLQLDGCAIVLNGVLVNTTEEVDDLAETNRYIDAEFIFVQAKTGNNFDGAEISSMFFGVRELLSVTPSLPRNERLAAMESVIRHIYTKSAMFRHGNPRLKMFYVTTGRWQDDEKLVARIDNECATLDDLNIFETVVFAPVDARKLQQFFNRASNVLSKTINFGNRVTLPTTDDAREAYLGYLPVSEYLALITDEGGGLHRGLFYDNVRDFQHNNPVNREIEDTLRSTERESFVLLNNGVTVVADELKTTGDRFTVTGFQIVNGCQTSHVLYNNREHLTANVFVPVKLIISPEPNLKNLVTKATNRQTVVKNEELSALTDFQKHLEDFYAAIPAPHRLFYDRRSQQYRTVPGLEKVRIVTISSQIRSFASMFLQRPHQASRYYGTLLRDIESSIFVEGHSPLAYYISAYAIFRTDGFLRRRMLDNRYRPFKYHILGILRMQVAGLDMPDMGANRFARYCRPLQDVLWDEDGCLAAIQAAAGLLDGLLGGDYDRDRAKDSTIQTRAYAAIGSPAVTAEADDLSFVDHTSPPGGHI
jgi:hypothetical protein